MNITILKTTTLEAIRRDMQDLRDKREGGLLRAERIVLVRITTELNKRQAETR